MRQQPWFFCSALVALLATGCDEPTEEPLSLVVQGGSTSVRRVEHALKQWRHMHVPELGVGYSISVVEPDPSIDYKIVQVYPDPTVDYKIEGVRRPTTAHVRSTGVVWRRR